MSELEKDRFIELLLQYYEGAIEDFEGEELAEFFVLQDKYRGEKK